MSLSMSSILASLALGGWRRRETGRPGYQPSVLLKLYIYGYLNRVQSSRRLEREAGRNVEVMWLTGRLVPDHKTIADFRKDNGTAIRKVCARFVALCRELGSVCRCLRCDRWLQVQGGELTRPQLHAGQGGTAQGADRGRASNVICEQLDTADRQEPSEARTMKTQRLTEKLAMLKGR